MDKVKYNRFFRKVWIKLMRWGLRNASIKCDTKGYLDSFKRTELKSLVLYPDSGGEIPIGKLKACRW